jgi:hypothetical protein
MSLRSDIREAAGEAFDFRPAANRKARPWRRPEAITSDQPEVISKAEVLAKAGGHRQTRPARRTSYRVCAGDLATSADRPDEVPWR